MDSTYFSNLGIAIGQIFNFYTLLVLLFGVLVGIFLGILPGIGGTAALAIIFPLTYGMSVEDGILFLIAVYSAAEYGGSIPAILINTPGTGASAATVLDGYPLCQKGYPRKALMISLVSGVVGGVISTIVFIAFSPLLTWMGLQFGPIEMFAVGAFGLSVICTAVGKSLVLGYLSAALGAFIASIGPSQFSGYRFTMDMGFLMDGIPLTVVFIGFFAVPQCIRMLIGEYEEKTAEEMAKSAKNDRFTFQDMRRLWNSMLRGSLLGSFIGVIPGTGAGVANFLSYNEEMRWSKEPELFGTGVEEGIAGPEAANNAVVAGALVPTLTLGIPGSSAAALIMGLLIMKGINPGPMLFKEQGHMMMAIFLGLLVTNLLILVVGWAGIRVCSLVTKVPQRLLGPFIVVLVLTGTYAYQSNMDHVFMTMAVGLLGFYLDRWNVPILPLVLAYIMAPIMEYNLIRALMISRGDIAILYNSPIAMFILALTVLSVLYGIRRERKKSA
jgi:putative tricarboxylic transport membrane protein